MNRPPLLVLAILALALRASGSDFFGIPTGPPGSEPRPRLDATPAPVRPGLPVPSATPAPAGAAAMAQAAVIDSFGGIPWGSSLEAARAHMSRQPDISPFENVPNRLSYKGGTFAGRPIQLWGLDFAHDRLYRGAVILEKVGEVKQQYEEVKTLLLQKYGSRMTEKHEGPATIAEWKLPASPWNKDEKTLKCAIVHVDRRPRVKLVFIDETIKADLGAQ